MPAKICERARVKTSMPSLPTSCCPASDMQGGRGDPDGGDPVRARRRLARWLLERLEADAVVYQRFVQGPESPIHASIHLEGSARLQRLLEVEGEITHDLPSFLRPEAVGRTLRNRLRVWSLHDERESGRRSRRYREVLGPAGFSDQARLVGFEEARHVGYLAAVYLDGRVFPRERLPELSALEPAVRQRLVSIEALHRAVELPARLLLSDEGAVLFGDAPLPGCSLASRFLGWCRAEVARLAELDERQITAVFEGHCARFTRVEGAGGRGWLVEVEALPPVELDELDDLTARQREVVRLAVDGRTTNDIGRALGLSPNTVKCHLKKIYETLGVSRRAELIRLLQLSD